MRDLSQEKVWSFISDGTKGEYQKCQFRKTKGVKVENYEDLVAKIAAIQFRNSNYVLLFRGQNQDYRLDDSPKKNSTIRPTLFRRDKGYGVDHWNRLIRNRYEVLEDAENQLIDRWRHHEFEFLSKLERSAVTRWSILQHYEVCDTPLLDVTNSLRIAASFASLSNPSGKTKEAAADDTMADDAYIMVLAVPQISGGVTTCAYEEMQALRLSSICPPTAIRAHLQEGYLIGEYPELQTFDQKMKYELPETDFAMRLIAKFHFNPLTFWKKPDVFPRVTKQALYPNDSDELFDICRSINVDSPTLP